MPIKKFNYRNHAENIPLYEERGFTTFEESLNDNPIQWKRDWMVWYKGRIDDDDFYDDCSELFCEWHNYNLKDNVKVVLHNGLSYPYIEIYGTEGRYNPLNFTTKRRTDNFDHEQEILLENPPKDTPEYWSDDYKKLFKETCGNCVGKTFDGSNLDLSGFDYVNHIRYTRKPEQYPDWLKEIINLENSPSLAKPKKRTEDAAVKPEKYFTDPKNPFN